MKTKRLEALAVNDLGTRLVVLLLGDPHLLEVGQRGQDGAANADGILALGGATILTSIEAGAKALISFEHGGSTGQDNVAVQVLAD